MADAHPPARTVIPKGSEIRRLRLECGLTIEQLAVKAGDLSDKTVRRAEHCIPMFPRTLKGIADALGVELGSLIEGGSPSSAPSEDQRQFHLPLRRAEVDETQQILDLMERLTEMLRRKGHQKNEGVDVDDIREGSLIVTLGMSKEACAILDSLTPEEKASLGMRQEGDVYLVKGHDATGRFAWYYLLVASKLKSVFESHVQNGQIDISNYGTILASGYGSVPPDDIRRKMLNEYGFDVSASLSSITPQSISTAAPFTALNSVEELISGSRA